MKPRLLLAIALAASQPASANDFLNGLAKQAINSAFQKVLAGQPGTPRPAPAVAAASGAAGGAPLAPPRARIRFDEGAIFYADYMADYWSRPDAVTRGTTPSADAPGNIVAMPSRFGGKLNQPGVAEMRRKLEAVFPRVLAHPALANIRGASLRPGAYFGHGRGGPMGHALPGKASLIAYPVNLADPLTQKFPDGTFHTPGEGPSLVISVNDTDELAGRQPVGTRNGMTVLRDGYMLAISNTDRPLYVSDGSGGQVMNPDLIDTSRPRSDIQFMTVYVGRSSSETSEIVHQRVHPTTNTGRLVGVLYNTDWRALLQEVDGIR
ncbi:hypothetical protein [Massilia niastensis]|uniref:hypothetical protein n=1 Tax=Massilia niastensis TaxID=544911 RepID=UPI00037C10FC|nr:hypothetical protein [Massilia niastensis]